MTTATTAPPWETAFLEELAASRSAKKAAETAGITRQNAYKHRRTDARFAAAWDAVLPAAPKPRLTPGPQLARVDPVDSVDSIESDNVRGWDDAFFQSLRTVPNMSAAATAAGVHVSLVYRRLQSDPVFAERVSDAKQVGIGRLATRAMSKAFSDDVPGDTKMITWLLSRLAPDEFGDRIRQEVTGVDGGPVQHEAKVLSVTAIMADPKKRRLLEQLARETEQAQDDDDDPDHD